MERIPYMKKLSALFAVAFAVALTACGKSVAPPRMDSVFSCNASITYGEFTGTAVLSKSESGVWRLDFTSPDSLSGIGAALENGNLTLGYKNFSFGISSELPIETVAQTIFNAIDDAAQNAQSASGKGELVTVEGETQIGKYIVMLDRSNALVSVDVPSVELSVKLDCYNAGGSEPLPEAEEHTAQDESQ